MLSESEIKSLITLLEDDDPEVAKIIEDKILSIGVDMIPHLESEWPLIRDIEHQQKVENIIHKIQFKGRIRFTDINFDFSELAVVLQIEEKC